MLATRLFSPLLLFFLSLLLSTARSAALDYSSKPSEPCPAVSSRPSSCPIRCFRADPVCGADGITYWCGCPDAACAGERVEHSGPCKTGSSAAGLIPRQALLLVHIVWLFALAVAFLFGLL